MTLHSKLTNALNCAFRVRIASIGAKNDGRHVRAAGKWEGVQANMPHPVPMDAYSQAAQAANKLVTKDRNWSMFAFRHRLLERASKHQFDDVSDLVMTLRYFPTDVMTVHRTGTNRNSTIVQHEKIVQRVSLLPRVKALEMLCVDCVMHLDLTDPNESTITVATTECHEEIGQHSVWVRHCKITNDLWLQVVSVSRFKSWVPIFAKRYGRFLQCRAHRQAVQHLRNAAMLKSNTSSQKHESKEIFQDVNNVDLNSACVLVTGASGFVGSHLLTKLKNSGATIVAIDKKILCSTKSSENIMWVKGDISKKDEVEKAFNVARQCLQANNDKKLFVVHLAAYWDYELESNDKYKETNVTGTKNVTELSEKFNVERVVFASSLGVFSPQQITATPLTETSALAPTLRGAYGQSKIKGEKVINESTCSTSVVRFGGIFSNYCELPPLHALVQAWTSRLPIYNRIFPGILGNTAIPLVHVEDASNLLVLVLDRHKKLTGKQIHLACASDGSTFDNRRLFELLQPTGSNPLPLFVPSTVVQWSLSVVHTFMKAALPRKLHIFQVEQPWILEEHCDNPLYVDCSYTKQMLGWDPRNTEKTIEQMIATKKANPAEWKVRNSNRIAHL